MAPRPPRLGIGKVLVASLLSFALPGLGHVYCRQWRLAAVFSLPVVGGLGLGVVAAYQADLFVLLFDVRALTALAISNVLLLVWRLAAILAISLLARQRVLALVAIGLPLFVLAGTMHAIPAMIIGDLRATLDVITVELATPSPAVVGGNPPRSPLPRATPMSTPNVASPATLNILLLGIDAAPARTTHLTDTMLLLSIRIDEGRVALVSVPRDLYGVPLPTGDAYEAKLNSLLAHADARPGAYPGGGAAVLKQTIGGMLGCTINYFAAIDLPSFQRVIDAAGGVDIVVERPIRDPFFRFQVDAGLQHFDGPTALLFVRSRMGPGDSDFTRAQRQQDLLLGLYAKQRRVEAVPGWPAVMEALRASVVTDIPIDRLPEVVATLRAIDLANATRLVLQPPEYVTPAVGPGGSYILIPDLVAIRAAGERLCP